MKKATALSFLSAVPFGLLPAIVLLASTCATKAYDTRSLSAPPADDTREIAAYLGAASSNGGVATIPPGDYLLDGTAPIPIPSGVTVRAYGARFSFPAQIAPGARRVMFSGSNVTNFAWYGGDFTGHIFDPSQRVNTWAPNASTRVFVISTSLNGVTQNILFDGVHSNGICGAVVTVQPTSTDLAAVTSYSQEIRIQNCVFLRSGKFCWDYGYLWQQILWPRHYPPWQVQRALDYFPSSLVTSATISAGSDVVKFNNSNHDISVSGSDTPTYAVCFYGDSLPAPLILGQQYFVTAASTDFIKVSGTFKGAPISFTGQGAYHVSLMHNLQAAYYDLYQPTGAGPGRGAIDITTARDVDVTNCTLSSLGDLACFTWSDDVLFANNRILGARMGAIILTNHCQGDTVTGNDVDGADGSRVLTIEQSSNITVSYNNFHNGGRGSWLVLPQHVLLLGNVFDDNTEKSAANWQAGRRIYTTGDWESCPEVYITLEPYGGSYGPVSVTSNHFAVANTCAPDAISFDPNGFGITVINNLFYGRRASIYVSPGCKSVIVKNNKGAAP